MKRLVVLISLVLVLVGGFALFRTVSALDARITDRFSGRRWQLPARIYARPLELFTGRQLRPDQLEQELALLHYVKTADPKKPGDYRQDKNHFTLFSRGFYFSDGRRPATAIEVTLADNRITSLVGRQSTKPLPLFRLEPLHIASIYPQGNEDRLFIPLDQTPELLIKTLLLTEDRQFYNHFGLRPLAIVRALAANLRAGKTVQGGSTLTQQLVKNFFLSSKRTLSRKVNEALMALILEYRYSKDEILESYINEIYLGQNGQLAIHGFAMAGRFYFGRNLDELSPDQIALLVGMAKGASYYNPRRHPQRARQRRDHILATMARAGLLTSAEAERLRQNPLGVSKTPPSSLTPYPAFVQLVRRQLRRDYRDQDLRSEGLSIFTTLDPLVQEQAQQSVARVLGALEKERKMQADTLQGALVICSVDQGEVQAVVGDRVPGQAGFNRALDMQRPVGSVIKPAVYLTALERPDRYNLLTTLYDTPLKVPVNGTDWQPKNYDKKFHGPLPLEQALVHSLNVATVQLGMDLGQDTVIDTLHRLGITREITPYPSLLLGALELPPMEVLQMYQTIGAGGYRTPLRAILAVTDLDHRLLQRYPLTVEQAAPPGPVFCLTHALEEVARSGTAASLQQLLPKGLRVACKTGTTDELRDSWLAGFSGSQAAVAWVGRDDNKSTGLTGSSGALRVWASVMKNIDTAPLAPRPPADIVFYLAELKSGKIYARDCHRGTPLPFIRGGLLPELVSCGPNRRQPARPHRAGAGHGFEQTLQKGIEQFLRIFQ